MGTLALQIEITAIKTHFSFKYEWCHFCERLKNKKRIHYAIFGLAKVAFLVSKKKNQIGKSVRILFVAGDNED